VNYRGFVFFTSLNHPLESHRMIFGHIGSHNQDGVRIGEILRGCGGPSTPERCTQTGYRGAVSYSRLIADAIHAEAAGKQLANEIILLDIEGCSAEVTYRERMHHSAVAFFLDEGSPS
jgi:hypothetical protein